MCCRKKYVVANSKPRHSRTPRQAFACGARSSVSADGMAGVFCSGLEVWHRPPSRPRRLGRALAHEEPRARFGLSSEKLHNESAHVMMFCHMRRPCMGWILLSVCCSEADCFGGFVELSSWSKAARMVSDAERFGTFLCVAGAV